MSPTTAGYLTAVAALTGSAARPLGGYLADRFGGVNALTILLVGIGLVYAFCTHLPAVGMMLGLMVVGMVCLGMGNGAVFQLIPQRFPDQIGIVTGVVGALGGVGGFLLPLSLGGIKQLSGSFSMGFVVLALVAVGAVASLRLLVAFRRGWHLSWRVPQPAPAP